MAGPARSRPSFLRRWSIEQVEGLTWVLRLASFFLVEAACAYARRRLAADMTSIPGNAVVAIIPVSAWAFLAHQRFAFRGLNVRGSPLAAISKFTVLSLAVLDAGALAHGVARDAAGFIWMLATVLKFFIARRWLWSRGVESAEVEPSLRG